MDKQQIDELVTRLMISIVQLKQLKYDKDQIIKIIDIIYNVYYCF